MKSKEKKKLEQKAMALWKEKCFELYGRECELCGNTYLATPHHFYYRSSCPHLKFEPLNGVILCVHCHSRLHFKDPKLVENQIIKKRGKKWLNKLTKLAEKKMGSSYLTFDYYKKIIKELE